jgi:hypothetical protein
MKQALQYDIQNIDLLLFPHFKFVVLEQADNSK